jgi:hypothetical protein
MLVVVLVGTQACLATVCVSCRKDVRYEQTMHSMTAVHFHVSQDVRSFHLRLSASLVTDSSIV